MLPGFYWSKTSELNKDIMRLTIPTSFRFLTVMIESAVPFQDRISFFCVGFQRLQLAFFYYHISYPTDPMNQIARSGDGLLSSLNHLIIYVIIPLDSINWKNPCWLDISLAIVCHVLVTSLELCVVQVFLTPSLILVTQGVPNLQVVDWYLLSDDEWHSIRKSMINVICLRSSPKPSSTPRCYSVKATVATKLI